jgi:pimeloyl-ACP methyl ester carboxylesterase
MTGAAKMQRVRLNGSDVEYEVRGSGTPVVFIHGAILSDGFVPVIEQPGIAENFQIVHYRRRGYAGSSNAPAGMTMQGWAGDCIALLDHLGIASAHVAGHSFGACVALQMAIDAPDRVRKLALLEPPLGSLVPSGAQFGEWVATVREIYESGDKTRAMDFSLAGAYGQDYRRFSEAAMPAGSFDRAASDIDTYFQVEIGAMQGWNITTEGLEKIRRPVLSMRGSDTLPVFAEGAELLHQWIPEIDTVSIPGANHDLPGRNPGAVADVLVKFFTEE